MAGNLNHNPHHSPHPNPHHNLHHLRLWQFELDGDEEELRFELHRASAARGFLAPDAGAGKGGGGVGGKDGGGGGGGGGGAKSIGLIQPPTEPPLAVATASVPFVMATPALDLYLPIRAAETSALLDVPADIMAGVLDGQGGVVVDTAGAGWHLGEAHVQTLFVPQVRNTRHLSIAGMYS